MIRDFPTRFRASAFLAVLRTLTTRCMALIGLLAATLFTATVLHSVEPGFDPTVAVLKQMDAMQVKPSDWP